MKAILHKYWVTLLASACLAILTDLSFGKPDAPEGAAIVSTVEAFHKAIEAGAPDKAMALLAPDALIIEGGYIQTRSDYQREHLNEDIAFARAVPLTSSNVAVRQEGNVAWVTTTSRVVGEFHKKFVDSTGAETVILTKATDGWRIRSIHWSSHRAPAS